MPALESKGEVPAGLVQCYKKETGNMFMFVTSVKATVLTEFKIGGKEYALCSSQYYIWHNNSLNGSQ